MAPSPQPSLRGARASSAKAGPRAIPPCASRLSSGVRGVSPTARLFFETDPVLKGWNPDADADAVAAAAVNTSNDCVSLYELDELLAWGPRRLNPTAYYLVMHDGVEQAAKGSDSGPYAYSFLVIGAKTRLFAVGS